MKRGSKSASVCNSFAEDHKQKQESGSNALTTPQEFQLQFSLNEFRFGKAATNPRKLVGKRESGAAINLYMVPFGSRDSNVKQQRTSCRSGSNAAKINTRRTDVELAMKDGHGLLLNSRDHSSQQQEDETPSREMLESAPKQPSRSPSSSHKTSKQSAESKSPSHSGAGSPKKATKQHNVTYKYCEIAERIGTRARKNKRKGTRPLQGRQSSHASCPGNSVLE